MTISFFVPGVPVAQGNHRRNRHGAIYETSKGHAPWRDSIIYAAQQTTEIRDIEGPIRLELLFWFPRLKSHYRSQGGHQVLREDAPVYKVTEPDIDKLSRSVLDALKIAGIYHDDSQVANLSALKLYSDEPGLTVVVGAIT